VLLLEHVTKSFHARGRAASGLVSSPQAGVPPVVRDVSLRVPSGCLYGLIGPGAAGKSVLLKLLVGLLRPDTGRIEVDGADVTG
jgi:ABC-type multidrug transport system ATPase subunit